jgi:hypothetical protein
MNADPLHADAARPRHDMYRMIHKGLRSFMAETLVAAGTMDVDDDGERVAVLGRVRSLLAFCRDHLAHEDEHVHPAMEAREPGSTGRTAGDHVGHAHMFDTLEAGIAAVEAARGTARAEAAHALYCRLAAFVGENFVHMAVEESHNNAVLWRNYDDAELVAIHDALVATIPPEDMAFTIRVIAPAVTPAERARFLADVRASAPPPAFRGILDMVLAHLKPADRGKLVRDLALPAAA